MGTYKDDGMVVNGREHSGSECSASSVLEQLRRPCLDFSATPVP